MSGNRGSNLLGDPTAILHYTGRPMPAKTELERLLEGATGISLQDLLKRSLAHVQRLGRPAPPVSLPASKTDSPKVLALDANKWIELSRANLGQPAAQHHREALETVRRAVQAGKLVVPILGVNALEAAEHRDPARRERLASFMVDLSNNLSFLDPLSAGRHEVASAVCRRTTTGPLPPLRPHLLYRGVGAAVTGKSITVEGGTEDMNAAINLALQAPELSVLLLAHAIDRATVEDGRATDRDGLRKLEGIRVLDQELPLEERRLLEVRTLLTEGGLAERVRLLFKELGAEHAYRELIASDNDLLAFELEVPSVHVPGTLMRWRDRDKNNASHVNDFKDFSFLEQAIPYANIVVTENQWAAIARATRLDRHYATVVISDLKELPRVLADIGCGCPL